MIEASELKIGDELIWAADGQTFKITGFNNTYGGNYDETGIEMVRFIKTRSDWAKVPKAFYSKQDWKPELWTRTGENT